MAGIVFIPATVGFATLARDAARLAAVDSDNFTTALQQGIAPADLDGTVATSTRANLASDPVDAETQRVYRVSPGNGSEARYVVTERLAGNEKTTIGTA